MTGKRTRYSADFKAKVALEALRGELTKAQLAAKHGIHQTMVSEWKRQAMEGLTAVFSGKSAAQESAKTDIGWGHQIRNYVLAPYQLVKDLRTGTTSTSPGDVLDGEIDDFIAAALAQRVTGETVEVEDVD